MTPEAPQPTPAPPAPAASPKGFWARMKHHILHPELTPRQVALSFAIGFAIAWNPLVGLHTWMVLTLCLLFKHLHRPLMIAAMLINNPWSLVPIATASTVLGNLLLGRGLVLDFAHIQWHTIGWKSFLTLEGFQAMRTMLEPILLPYFLGGAVLSLAALPVGYYIMLATARRLRMAAAAWHPTSNPTSNPVSPE